MTFKISASEIAGNWKGYDGWSPGSFWYDLGPDWGKVSLFCDMSDLLTKSNGRAIVKAMQPYVESGDAIITGSDNTFMGGDVTELAIRVYKENDDPDHAAGLEELNRPYRRQTTEAFGTLEDLYLQMKRYPVLDEEDFYLAEDEMSAQAIEDIGSAWLKPDAPLRWAFTVLAWMRHSEFWLDAEPVDGGGAQPHPLAVLRALNEVGKAWLKAEYIGPGVYMNIRSRGSYTEAVLTPEKAEDELDRTILRGEHPIAKTIEFAKKYGFDVVGLE